MMRVRRGVALVTTLGVISLASVLAFAAAEGGHLALNGTRNRVGAARGHWLAEGCAARAIAELDARWSAADDLARERLWRTLDEVAAGLSIDAPAQCVVRLESRGARLDLRRTRAEDLARLVDAVHRSASGYRIATGILAWHDSVGDAGLNAPVTPLRRNALASHLEQRFGLRDSAAVLISTLLSNGTGPVDVGRAPWPVLAALPGFNTRMAFALVELRGREPHLRDLYAMLDRLSREDATELSAAFLELSRETVFLPPTWTLIASASAEGDTPAAVTWSVGRSARHLVAAPETR